MLDQCFEYLRRRYHYLHWLRQNDFFSNKITPLLDQQLSLPLYKVKWPVALKLMRNLPWMLNSRYIDPGLASLVVALAKVYKPQVFWDVGANIGYFSWLLLGVDTDVRVVLFEPDPVNAQLLKQTHKQVNNDAIAANIHVVEKAVCESSGQAAFATDIFSGATGSMEVENTFSKRNYRRAPESINVQTISLDEYWHSVNKDSDSPQLIKIDVEMSEQKVFNGGMKLIEERKPILIFECYHEFQAPILDWLTKLGYVFFDADRACADLNQAINFLAVPPQCKPALPELVAVWSYERKAR